MALFTTSLNSGSNANCYYIGNGQEAVLIDAGLSCRETKKRMQRLGLPMEDVKAIFVSHEHSDHIRGLAGLAGKYQLPVYITPRTLQATKLSAGRFFHLPLLPGRPVQVGDLTVTAFPKWHDAADPQSFVVEGQGIRVGVFTDIGAPCEEVLRHFGSCHAAFLEANYDEKLLEEGTYPAFLKSRISSEHGHLSNQQALALFRVGRPAFMSHLFLAHLSQHNNCPQLVGQLFSHYAGQTEIIVASRFQETALYRIGHGAHAGQPAQVPATPQADYV